MNKPSIQILDTDLSNKHSISGYNSLEFTRAWNSQGYFKLVINKANKTAKYLATDKILYIDEKRIGYIKKRSLSEKDNKANALIIIEGVELKDELARITYPDDGQTTDSYYNEYTETIVKSLINKNAGINVSRAERQIPNLETAADNNRGSQVSFSTRYKDLMSEIYKLLGSELMGLKCSIDFDESKIIFDVAVGNDKKAVEGSEAGVVLSVDLNTADAVEVIEDKSGYRNVVIAAGLGAGTERTIVEVGDTDSSGYSVNETYLDVRDIVSNDEINERAKQRLAETKTVKGKTIKFNETGPRKLDEAFTLGDFITTKVEEEYEDAQVIKVLEVYSGIAAPDINLVLDFDYMDSLAKTFKINNENNKNVVASDSPSSGGGVNPNIILDSNFSVDQLNKGASFSSISTDVYTIDMWKAGASGVSCSFAKSGGISTCTITAGQIAQEVWGDLLETATYTLSWSGTAQARVAGGSFAASPINISATAGTDILIEWGTGTLLKPKLEKGSSATEWQLELYNDILLKCQFYLFPFAASGLGDSVCRIASGTAFSSSVLQCDLRFAQMRVMPTLYYSTDTDYFRITNAVISAAVTNIAHVFDNGLNFMVINVTASGMTTSQPFSLRRNNVASYLYLDARI